MIKYLKPNTTLLIVIILFITIIGCSGFNKIIYEEEMNINKYEKNLLYGYEEAEYIKLENKTIYEDKNFILYTQEEVDSLIIKYSPKLAGKKYGNEILLKNIFEKSLLQDIKDNKIYFGNQEEFIDKAVKADAIAVRFRDYYDPFTDKQVPSVRIYKNDTDFYILYYFYFPSNPAFHQPYFYPLLSVEDYEDIFEKAYNDFLISGDRTYLNFKGLYKLQSDGRKTYYEEKYGKYFDNEPESFYFIRTLDTPPFVYYNTIHIDFFKKYGFTMQDARKNYKRFGYIGYDPLLVILPVKINFDNDKVKIGVDEDSIYYSSAVIKAGYKFEYTLNSELLKNEWILIN